MKSLAEQLAELATPAPRQEFEPADGLVDHAPVMESDEELDQLASQMLVPERKRMRSDIALDDPAYRGRKASRKDVFTEQAAGGGSAMDDDEDDDGDGDAQDALAGELEREEDSEMDSGDAGGAALHSEDDSGLMSGGETGEESDEASDGDEEAASDEEASDGDAWTDRQVGAEGEPQDDEDEAAALEREYAQMQAADASAGAAAAASAQAEADAARARAVANQKRLWERVLGVRILLQRSLTCSHRLPGEGGRAAVLAHSAPVATEFAACQDACQDALKDLLDVQAVLLGRNPGVAEASGGAHPAVVRRLRGAETSADELWQEMEDLERAFAPFRDASLDRWHRKSMLATGRAAMKSQLKALNQSLSQQVALLMRDPARAIARTQLPLATRPRQLCEAPAAAAAAAAEVQAGANGQLPGDAKPEAAAREADRAAWARAIDPHTYDDSDFYQLLLKEFLEASKVDDATIAAMRAPKTRKLVDRRASKGRKIRYHVIDKLVNFMTPTLSSNEEMVQNIFSNLFGKAAVTA